MTANAFRPVPLAIVQATQPFFVYNRLALVSGREYDLYSVPYGYNYLLRRVISRWDAIGAAPIPNGYTLGAEVFNAAYSRARQNVPVPFPLFSSPGGDTAAVALVGAPLGISFAVLPRTSARILNLGFPYGDTIKLVINSDAPAAAPSFVDVVFEGYLVAEGDIAMWGNKRKGARRGNN